MIDTLDEFVNFLHNVSLTSFIGQALYRCGFVRHQSISSKINVPIMKVLLTNDPLLFSAKKNSDSSAKTDAVSKVPL